MQWLRHLSCGFFGLQKTHITDVTESRSLLSASCLETVMAPGTEHSWARSSYTIGLSLMGVS